HCRLVPHRAVASVSAQRRKREGDQLMGDHLDLALGPRRDPPEHVLAGLRQIDLRADLHYAGEGCWVLGVATGVVTSTVRATAMKILQRESSKLKPNGSNIRLADAMLRGFREIARYQVQGSPDSSIVHDFRERDWWWRVAPDARFEQHADYIEGI